MGIGVAISADSRDNQALIGHFVRSAVGLRVRLGRRIENPEWDVHCVREPMYRFVSQLLQPFVSLACLTLLGAAVLWWRRRETRPRLLLVTVPLVCLAVMSTPVVSYLALGSLEWQYPPCYDTPREAETIVVLSGHVRPPDRIRLRAELGDNTLGRCLHAAELYDQGKPCLVVLCGGKVDPSTAGPTFAAAMCDFMVQQGVARSDLLLEDQSRTTYENAVETARLLRGRGIEKIVLVTSATHMQRAERCFRSQGFDVRASGCRYRATQFRWSLSQFLPDAGSARDVEDVAHEWLGLFWYWLHGRI